MAAELEGIDKIDVSAVVNSYILAKLLRLAKLKQIIEKSELTEEQVMKLGSEVNERMYEICRKLYEEKFEK